MTIKDISEALNVSISTVSKALNDATDIAENTKAKIRKYAESTGYQLKTGIAEALCLFYIFVNSPCSLSIIEGIKKAVRFRSDRPFPLL